MPIVWIRVALAAGLILAVAAGLWKTYHAGYKAGESEVMAEWQAESLAAQAKARQIEQAQAKAAQEAINAARVRESRQKADADRARAESDGLRDELAAAIRDLPSAACDAVRSHAAALNDVFGQCARTVEEMARQADGHASDSLTYQQAWPK